ncbi:MAG: glycoside-pentoside-hexuronide (GPH):cation symporter [Spirochaetales bacterium]|nr:glycoside-pentoside-hexuronide (GPH):cation symporter [Spirochaetales bacterium]
MEKKVSFREKLAYGVGDAGCNFVWTTIGSFLTLYYTDSVGISAAVVGTIMFITRLLDGVSDLGMGLAIDKTSTRWGKARPWVLWSALPMAIGLILLFNVPSSLGCHGKVVYAFITYIFVAVFAYTACNLSYNTLLSLVATEQQDRTLMSTIRFMCTLAAVILISYLTMGIVEKVGWSGMSLIYGALTLILLLITFLGTKERVSVGVENKTKNNLPVGKAFIMLFRNKYFYMVVALFLLTYAAMGATQGIGIYYARDVLGNTGLFGTLTLAGLVPTFLILPIFPVLTKKWGKWKVLMIGLVIQVIGFIPMFLFPTNSTIVILGLIVKGLGTGPLAAGLFAMVADVVDYGEWKTGERIDGLTYSATSFGMKVGTGLGTAIVGWSLAIGHYDGAAAVQPASAIAAMKILYYVIPAILGILSLIVLYFTNIDKIYPKIRKDLDLKAKASNTVK